MLTKRTFRCRQGLGFETWPLLWGGLFPLFILDPREAQLFPLGAPEGSATLVASLLLLPKPEFDFFSITTVPSLA